jgi:hypothetical protein
MKTDREQPPAPPRRVQSCRCRLTTLDMAIVRTLSEQETPVAHHHNLSIQEIILGHIYT